MSPDDEERREEISKKRKRKKVKAFCISLLVLPASCFALPASHCQLVTITMKISWFLVTSVLLGGHTLTLLNSFAAGTTLTEESFEYAEQEEESYLYYYEDENIATSKTTDKETLSTTTIIDESSTPPSQHEEKPKRKKDNSITTIPSGFAQKPRDDDEIDDETSNVTPLWDNEPYMLEVKASYGCIMQDERVQLDNELFGFEVEVSDMEKLKQDRMQRIRKDREREWNRKESIKLPKQQQVLHNLIVHLLSYLMSNTVCIVLCSL